MTDPLHEPLPRDREQAKALAEQMAAKSEGSARCVFGDHPMFYAPYDVALVPGHIYSELGLKEAGISSCCEYCFDKEFMETDDDEVDEAALQDECAHDWKPRGFNVNYGQIYECEKCGGVTP